jgi:membrane-bound lytic murein transglycosylase A
MGELAKGHGSMQDIRAWFAAHPERYDEIVDQNASVVFFAIATKAGGQGSSGVVLTPKRSIAVDRASVAMSTPLWVDTVVVKEPWRHLMIAQDTGGGILGAVRGDLYMGDDAEATEIAGRTSAPGRWWLLLPKTH